MTIDFTCPVCGLQVTHRPASGTVATTQFDSSSFRDKCIAPHPTKSFNCPNLNKVIASIERDGVTLDA